MRLVMLRSLRRVKPRPTLTAKRPTYLLFEERYGGPKVLKVNPGLKAGTVAQMDEIFGG